MKVLPVSFKSQNNYDMNYLYRRENVPKPDYTNRLKQYTIATASVAFLAVVIALINVGKKK